MPRLISEIGECHFSATDRARNLAQQSDNSFSDMFISS